MAELENDILRMVENAKTYNAEGSNVYNDAIELWNFFSTTVGKTRKKEEAPVPSDGGEAVNQVQHGNEIYKIGIF